MRVLKEFPHYLVGRVLVIGRLLRRGSIVRCILIDLDCKLIPSITV
jgi:hypothetical protein